jgi:hypothetical protein
VDGLATTRENELHSVRTVVPEAREPPYMSGVLRDAGAPQERTKAALGQEEPEESLGSPPVGVTSHAPAESHGRPRPTAPLATGRSRCVRAPGGAFVCGFATGDRQIYVARY